MTCFLHRLMKSTQQLCAEVFGWLAKHPLGAGYGDSHGECCRVDSVERRGPGSDCGGLKSKWGAEKENGPRSRLG